MGTSTSNNEWDWYGNSISCSSSPFYCKFIDSFFPYQTSPSIFIIMQVNIIGSTYIISLTYNSRGSDECSFVLKMIYNMLQVVLVSVNPHLSIPYSARKLTIRIRRSDIFHQQYKLKRKSYD